MNQEFNKTNYAMAMLRRIMSHHSADVKIEDAPILELFAIIEKNEYGIAEIRDAFTKMMFGEEGNNYELLSDEAATIVNITMNLYNRVMAFVAQCDDQGVTGEQFASLSVDEHWLALKTNCLDNGESLEAMSKRSVMVSDKTYKDAIYNFSKEALYRVSELLDPGALYIDALTDIYTRIEGNLENRNQEVIELISKERYEQTFHELTVSAISRNSSEDIKIVQLADTYGRTFSMVLMKFTNDEQFVNEVFGGVILNGAGIVDAARLAMANMVEESVNPAEEVASNEETFEEDKESDDNVLTVESYDK